MQITASQAPEMLGTVLEAGLVPYLASSPGIGKSAIAKQLAKDYNLEFIDIRLAGYDPTSIDGFPMVTEDRTRAGYVPMDTFPLADTEDRKGDKIPKGKEGWLILLDELSSAPLSVQAAAYRLILDRQVGQYNLHEKVAIMAAGNLSTDNAIVNRIGTAMQSRLIHFELAVNNDAWLAWANRNNIDHRIMAFINFRPGSLHKFSPDHNDKTFPCPRTWEFVSRMSTNWTEIDYTKVPIIAGTIGEGMAREFVGFCKIYEDLPTIAQLLANPSSFTCPSEPSIRFAIVHLIANHFNETTASALTQVLNVLPKEFQIIGLKRIMATKQSYIHLPEMRDWIRENKTLLIDI